MSEPSSLPSPTAPPPARPWLPTALVGALAVLALGGSAWLNPFRAALGSGASEAPGHLFGLWSTASHLFVTGPLVRAAEVGYPSSYLSHLMDPINLALFLPFYWLGGGGALGATMGWNALHAGWVAIGAWGSWRLARRVVGDVPALGWSAALLAAVFCLSPYVLYVPYMGRTEYLPALLYPLHLSLLHAWLRAPVGLEGGEREAPPPLSTGLLAALTLGAIALGGWYLAIFAALAEIPIALWLARGLPLREAAARLGLVATLAMACTLPAAWALLHFPPEDNSVLVNSEMAVSPLTYVSDPFPPIFRVPLRSAPNRWMDQPAYVGLGALLLGLGAGLRRPRQALWPLLTLWLLSFSVGPYLVWEAPSPTGPADDEVIRSSTWWLMKLAPPVRAMRTWSRIAVLASLPAGVGVAAAYALLASRLSATRARLLGGGLLAALLLDQGTWPVRYTPIRPWFSPAPPAELLEALETLPEGAVLDLPVDISMRPGGGPEERGQYVLWQLEHGRPTSSTPNGFADATLSLHTLPRLAVNTQILSVAVRGGSLDPETPTTKTVPAPHDDEIACAREDAQKLAEIGFAAVVLHRTRPGSSELDELLQAVLGDPSFSGEAVMVWSLARVPPAEGSYTCTLPSLPLHIARRVDRRARAR